ncbi:hypothetical protein NMG60_11007300 [Bertholletia excelsa]
MNLLINRDFQKSRTVLGDVTNRLGKRGLLQIWGNLGCKSRDRHGEDVDNKEGDSQFTQEVCQGAENIVKERCGIICALDNSDKGKTTCLIQFCILRPNISILKTTSISKIPREVEETNSSSDSLHNGKSSDRSVDVDGSPKDNFVCGISLPMSSRPSVDVEGNNDKAKELFMFVGRIAHDIGVDNFAFRKYDSIESSKPPKSHGSGSFKLEKCTGLNGNKGSNLTAYIWSDFHYQDMKGQIAAQKKSQKEANIMVERSCTDKETDKHGQGKYQKYSMLESDLDILVREGSQLVRVSFLTFPELFLFAV